VAEDSFANGSPAIHFLPLYSPYREYFADANEERSIEHANGSPAIHFLPLYSPYRECFADANEERSIEHAACHHELKPRDEVNV
jgi:hypothetical protein